MYVPINLGNLDPRTGNVIILAGEEIEDKPDFAIITRSEFTCGTLRERQYILEHREDEEALSIYVERFRDPNSKVYLPEQGLNDPDVAMALREHLEQRRNQA